MSTRTQLLNLSKFNLLSISCDKIAEISLSLLAMVAKHRAGRRGSRPLSSAARHVLSGSIAGQVTLWTLAVAR